MTTDFSVLSATLANMEVIYEGSDGGVVRNHRLNKFKFSWWRKSQLTKVHVGDSRFNVFVLFRDTRYKIEVTSNFVLRDLILALESKTFVPTDVYFTHNSKPLRNGFTFFDYNICENSTLIMNDRILGGSTLWVACTQADKFADNKMSVPFEVHFRTVSRLGKSYDTRYVEYNSTNVLYEMARECLEEFSYNTSPFLLSVDGCLIEHNKKLIPYCLGKNFLSVEIIPLELQAGDSQQAWNLLQNIVKDHMNVVDHVFDRTWILTQVENLGIVLNMIQKCATVSDYQCLLHVICRLYTGKVATVELANRISDLFCSEVQGFEAEDIVKQIRSAFNGTLEVFESKTVKKLTSLYSFLLTQGFLKFAGFELNDDDYSRMEQRVMINNFSSKKGLIFCVFDLSLHFCESYIEYVKTGEYSQFLSSNAALDKWFKEADRILGLGPFVGNLQAHGTSYFSFLGDLNDAIEKGTAYAKYAEKMYETRENVVVKKLNQLQLLKNTEITRKAAQQERSAPMGVLIYGHSSVAKSAFTKMLFNYYGGLFNLERGDQYRYVRNPLDEYWSNFDTSKWCVQLDDIAFLHPAKTTTVDSTLQDLLNVVNNVPYVPPQAALEDKGKTPVLARLVLATSNSKDLNAQEYFWCPLAVRRRLPYVVNVEPRQEYLHANGVFIDPQKLQIIDGEFPNWWRIHVQKVVPCMDGERERARLETVHVFENTNEFLRHFGKACREHENNQVRAMRKNDDMQTIEICQKCYLPLPHFECVEVQSDTSDYVSKFWCCLFWLFEKLIEIRYMYSFFMILCRWNVLRRWSYHYFIRFTHEKMQKKFYLDFLEQEVPSKIKKLLVCLGLISLTLAAYNVVQYKGSEKKKKAMTTEYEEQGNVHGTTEKDLPRTERSNVWYNPTLDLCQFDVPIASKSLQHYDVNDVRNLVSPNCVLLKIRGIGGNSTRTMRGIFTRAHFLLTNGHAFLEDFEEYTVVIQKINGGQMLGPNHTIHIKRSEIIFSADNDVCMLMVSSMPPHKDLRYIWNDRQIPITRAVEFIRDEDGTVLTNQIFAISYVDSLPVDSLGHINVYHGMGEIETKKGFCGSLCVSMTPRGPVIMGIHVLGKEKQIAFLHVTKRELEDLEQKCNITQRPIIQGGGKPQLNLNGVEMPLTKPHHKSIFRYLEQGTVNIYGSLGGFRAKPKSKVCETPLSSEIREKYNVPIAHGPPCMDGWEPWRKNVVEMVKPNVTYDRQILKQCVDGYVSSIVENLPIGWEKELIFLSDKASVNGLPGVIFIDGINRKSSMGFPWNRTKKSFLFDEKDELYPDGCNFGPEVWDRVKLIEQAYTSGSRAFPVFTGHLKDEATPLKKVEMKKTRLFTGAPIDWSLVVRKHLLSFVRLVQLNKYTFEAGPGMVTQSIEWTELHDYLCEHGENQIVAGDYGKFDKRMIADFILAAFDVIIQIYRKAGFSEEEVRIIAGIAEDTAFPVSNLNNDLVEFYGTNPSGHPLTVIINSLVNALYMRYCYVLLNPEKECRTFKSNVNLMTYGDDNVMGVSAKSPWFNHTAIQAELAKIGVEYTMADKESESVPYINLKDVSFLKRTWRFENEMGYWMAPLEESSIIKSLTVWVPSSSVDKYYQMVDVLNSASNEYFFYGREKHDEMRSFFLQLVSSEPYKHYVQDAHFPSYDQLCDRFLKASAQLQKERS